MHRVAPWRARSHRPRNAAASSPLSVTDLKQNLGRKVSIRFRVHGDTAHPFSEAIGMIQKVTQDDAGVDVVEIVNRRGSVSRVPVGDIVAGKFFPH